MAANDNVGTLEEESLKRKERLKALKRKQEFSEITEGTKSSVNSSLTDLPKPKFRSYRPVDEKLKEQIIEDAKPGNVESEVKEHLEAANTKVVIEELDISNLAPRKPDWDLKRDVAKKLEKLERRTHKAIAELIRERLKNEIHNMDLAATVALAAETAETQSENTFEYGEGEFPGEEYVPHYVCLPKKPPEEEICESETTCSEARTTTGNILHRLIRDPLGRRPPCLGKWPSYASRSESDLQENTHQFRASQQPTLLKQMCSLRITSEPNPFRQPAIVGTIGPSSTDVPNILELITAGMNIARVSMAHTNPCNTLEPFRNIVEASNRYKTMKDYEIPVTIMMDLKGPEIRTGKIDASRLKFGNFPEIFIKEGSYVRLTSDRVFEERCTEKIIYVNYAGLIGQMEEGNPIYISDGQIKLRVDLVEKTSLVCVAENGGMLRNYQKVHVPMLPALLPALSDYDLQCLDLAIQMEVDVVVVPMTRNSEVIKQVKKILGDKEEGKGILVFAKISTYEGLENLDCIIRVADGIVIQKNDLSLEICPEKMFIAQKEIIGKCNRAHKPVFCTAELSSSKSMNNICRRAEMNDISGAILDGADGIILITETATKEEGADTICQLSSVMKEAEAATMQKLFINDLADELVPSIEPSKAVALAAVQVCNKIQAAAILAVTTSGKTAQFLSWFRPRRPVIAITRVGRVARQMNLWRAILPLHFSAPTLPDWFQDVKARFEYGISYGRHRNIIESGDLLVLVSGYRKKAGFTNCIRIVFASLEPSGLSDNVSTYYDEATKENSLN